MNLTEAQIAEQIERQRIEQEAKEQEAINKMINNDVEDRFKTFVQCTKCGVQKKHDNIPLCDKCWAITDQQIQKEEQEFIQGKYFAGMNQVVEEAEEDDFATLMSNLDKYIK